MEEPGGGLGGFAKEIARTYATGFAREQFAHLAQKNGLSALETNAILMGLSILGDSIGTSRLKAPKPGEVELHGILSRQWYQAPFDAVDIVLAYQGLPTGAAWKYLLHHRGASIVAHSLGAIDAANIVGWHAAVKASLNALPFGSVAPLGAQVDVFISGWDAVSGFVLGQVVNPEADDVQGSPFGHDACDVYKTFCPK